jgi:hypothetical protein
MPHASVGEATDLDATIPYGSIIWSPAARLLLLSASRENPAKAETIVDRMAVLWSP